MVNLIMQRRCLLNFPDPVRTDSLLQNTSLWTDPNCPVTVRLLSNLNPVWKRGREKGVNERMRVKKKTGNPETKN
jgi:hypothetical protein